jgi:hypothetical protein
MSRPDWIAVDNKDFDATVRCEIGWIHSIEVPDSQPVLPVQNGTTTTGIVIVTDISRNGPPQTLKARTY